MVTVALAEQIVLQQAHDYGSITIPLDEASGRILAEDIIADRDVPAMHRATMDGIAINMTSFEKGIRTYKIAAIQAAGDEPLTIMNEADCIEIMTGASLSAVVNVVVPYEDIDITDGFATIRPKILKPQQNIHLKGSDSKIGEIIVEAGSRITPDIINAAVFTGYQNVLVKKLPRVVVLSSGDELTDVHETPPDYKIRRSNSYTLKAALAEWAIDAEMEHLPDDKEIIIKKIKSYLEHYDVIIMSGGVSKGKYDYISEVLEALSVEKLFHRIQQKPGKPFWFGIYNSTKIFAFPGNPVSTFLCFHRYFLPWLRSCLELETCQYYATLSEEVNFNPNLQYFLQVRVDCSSNAQLKARPILGNGSGDLVNLTIANAFMELPAERNNFKQGELFRIWPFKPIL